MTYEEDKAKIAEMLAHDTGRMSELDRLFLKHTPGGAALTRTVVDDTVVELWPDYRKYDVDLKVDFKSSNGEIVSHSIHHIADRGDGVLDVYFVGPTKEIFSSMSRMTMDGPRAEWLADLMKDAKKRREPLKDPQNVDAARREIVERLATWWDVCSDFEQHSIINDAKSLCAALDTLAEEKQQ